jgi:hypothetical protein
MAQLSSFAWALMVAGGLLLPIISITYLCLRLPGRRKQLYNLFTMEGILPHYLAMRGRLPKKKQDESSDGYAGRLTTEFDKVFSEELGQEYSTSRYVIPMLMAWGATAAAILFLVAEGFRVPFRANTPLPLVYAVLGAVFWTVWSAVRGYARTDLTPSTFYWTVFRYVLAVAYGLLAAEIFTEAFANLGAFVAATLPFSEGLRLIRSRLGGLVKWWTPVEGHPKLSEIQGMDPSTIENLEELGVHTTQELAFSDPLMLLLKSNFPPKAVIDWMDQSFLYNYVGEKIAQLRLRGIRGAIELAGLYNEPNVTGLVRSVSAVLGITEDDLRNLIRSLYFDNHLRLIWEIWGVWEQKGAQAAPE